MNRPIGVTVVSVLMVINGIILVGSSVWAVYFVPSLIAPLTSQLASNLTSDISGNLTDGTEIPQELGAALSSAIITTVMIIAGIGIALGIACFVLAWGLYAGRDWAWIITVILTIISIIFSLVAIGGGDFVNIMTLIIDAVILYYLYRPSVKVYFGRVKNAK